MSTTLSLNPKHTFIAALIISVISLITVIGLGINLLLKINKFPSIGQNAANPQKQAVEQAVTKLRQKTSQIDNTF